MSGVKFRQAQADTTGCAGCKHCRETALFKLCTAPMSRYTYDGKDDFHTIQHMRDIFVGPCGEDKKLFAAKVQA